MADHRRAVFDFAGFLGRSVWTAQPADADRYLKSLRKDRRLARATVQRRAWTLAQFFDFLLLCDQTDIHVLMAVVVMQPIDEFNRPAKARLPGRAGAAVGRRGRDVLFTAWREWLPSARKYLPAARDYLAASLWRRAGLRITETVMLDIGDWHPDLGEMVTGRPFRQGQPRPWTQEPPGAGPSPRWMRCWSGGWPTSPPVRRRLGRPGRTVVAERTAGPVSGRCGRVGPEALRAGLAGAVCSLAARWGVRLTPHGLRHFCASSLYRVVWVSKAIQELLGTWLTTTTGYIHVHAEHIEVSWAQANSAGGRPPPTGGLRRCDGTCGWPRPSEGSGSRPRCVDGLATTV